MNKEVKKQSSGESQTRKTDSAPLRDEKGRFMSRSKCTTNGDTQPTGTANTDHLPVRLWVVGSNPAGIKTVNQAFTKM